MTDVTGRLGELSECGWCRLLGNMNHDEWRLLGGVGRYEHMIKWRVEGLRAQSGTVRCGTVRDSVMCGGRIYMLHRLGCSKYCRYGYGVCGCGCGCGWRCQCGCNNAQAGEI